MLMDDPREAGFAAVSGERLLFGAAAIHISRKPQGYQAELSSGVDTPP
jgi:hypothetical protein